MAVGLRVRNSSGILQIDGTYQNLEMVSTGTLTMATDDNNLGAYADVSIPAGKNSPLLAIRTTSTGCYYTRLNATTFRVYNGSRVYTNTFTYYLFAEATTNPSGGVGLVVRNETTGAIVYNSNKKYLRILQPVITSMTVDGSLSYDFPGKTVAIVQGLRPNYRKITGGGQPQQPIFVIELKGGTMRTPSASNAVLDYRAIMQYTGFGFVNPATDMMPECNYMIIDVTGY